MITNTTDFYYLTLLRIDQTTYIFMHTSKVFFSYYRACALYMKDEVQVDFAKRLWHSAIGYAFAPSGRRFVLIIKPRALPWANISMPLQGDILLYCMKQGLTLY